MCRFGGEEFVILLPDTTVNDAAELIERLRGLIGDVISRPTLGRSR
ncbi:MAG: diguanylate cyclase [Vampirovibrionales bacterium]